MNKIIIILGLAVLAGVGYFLLRESPATLSGSSDPTRLSTCAHTAVNVSTTRQRALAATGKRQWVRLENSSTTTGVASEVFYVFSNTSTTVSTSTGMKLQAGEVEYIVSGQNLWNGDIWLLNNNATPVPVLIAECY